ncbi:cytochrome o ubiquinol oxidase subunit III [Bartonella sp. DGB1]|uniref:cytochrome o ubiquinol oxidase subunit III n=1 Tax=Bartonella sp. DGB1 TaxID=3239807 RepID=UPI003523B2B2
MTSPIIPVKLPEDGYHTAAEEHHDAGSLKIFGFWMYILTDCFIFALLFANYALFAGAYDGGPTGRDLFDLRFVLAETMVLLFSSITYGLALISAYLQKLKLTIIWLALTFLLGVTFIIMEIYEFHHLVELGAGPSRSAFWSAYYVLVGTHGIHVTTGLIWMAVMFIHLFNSGLNKVNRVRLACLSLFWHFLDIIWIGVFTLVYLTGVL